MVMASFLATALNSHVSCAFGNVWIHNKMNYYSCKTFLPTVATFTPCIYHSCPKENRVCQKCPSLQIYVLGRHLKIEQSPLTNQNFGWIKRPVDKGLGSRKVMRLLNTRIIDKLTQTIHIWVSFCRTGKMIKLCLKKIFFCRFTVTKRFNFFNFSQLFWRDFVLCISKIF